MSDNNHPNHQSVPVMLGRVIEMCESIKLSVDRIVVRADDLERRVEVLELKEAVRSSQPVPLAQKVVDKVIWAILAGVGVILARVAGLV